VNLKGTILVKPAVTDKTFSGDGNRQVRHVRCHHRAL